MNGGERDSLRPPTWIGTIAQECVNERLIELAGTY
jgi:hypothetical protein